MSQRKFCKRCYDKLWAAIVKKGLAGKTILDPSKMSFWCKIPRYTHDNMGRAMVVLLDCENMREIKMTLEEYKRREARGEV